MDCGTPFCNNGCPVNNIIPDFNDLVFRGAGRGPRCCQHQQLPEFTGRICPAPCEAACTLNINNDAVGIKSIEHAIIDRAWEEGWVLPQPPQPRPARRWPSSAAAGRPGGGPATGPRRPRVTVFEKNDRVGGLLRYGIPDFKMEKSHIDRRVAQMEAEGVVFRTSVLVGEMPADSKVTNWAKDGERRAAEGRVRRGAAVRRRRAEPRPAGARA
jgi:glutamate synthase (NADPH/NADH) small chain